MILKAFEDPAASHMSGGPIRLLLFALLLCLPNSSHAETRPAARVAADLTLSPSPTNDDVSAFGGSVAAAFDYRFRSQVTMGTAWAATFTSLEASSEGRRRSIDMGNLLLHAGYHFEWSKLALDLRLRAGAPLAIYLGGTIPKNRLSDFNYKAAASSRGWRDPFLWQQNAAPVITDVHMTVEPLAWLKLSAQVSPALLIAVNSRPSSFALHTRLSVAATAGRLTGRVGWAYFFSHVGLENNDLDQHGVWAALDWQLQPGHHLSVSANLSVDRPYGVQAGRAAPSWGLTLASRHSFSPRTRRR